MPVFKYLWAWLYFCSTKKLFQAFPSTQSDASPAHFTHYNPWVKWLYIQILDNLGHNYNIEEVMLPSLGHMGKCFVLSSSTRWKHSELACHYSNSKDLLTSSWETLLAALRGQQASRSEFNVFEQWEPQRLHTQLRFYRFTFRGKCFSWMGATILMFLSCENERCSKTDQRNWKGEAQESRCRVMTAQSPPEETQPYQTTAHGFPTKFILGQKLLSTETETTMQTSPISYSTLLSPKHPCRAANAALKHASLQSMN